MLQRCPVGIFLAGLVSALTGEDGANFSENEHEVPGWRPGFDSQKYTDRNYKAIT